MVAYMIFVTHEDWSTWLSFATSATQQSILLALLCWYEYRAWATTKDMVSPLDRVCV